MASVYEKAGKWYLRWKAADGRWRDQVSTAQTKTEARRHAGELERRAERQRLGLEPLPTDSSMALAQLCEWWLRERCPTSSASRERSRLRKHVIDTWLGHLPLIAVNAARIEERQREMERDGLGRSYLNGLRCVLHTVFARARRDQLWTGPNPVEGVEKRPETKRTYVTSRAEEVPTLLAAVPDDWRAIFAAAVYTGLRKGELFGLRKVDVHLPNRAILVCRSWCRSWSRRWTHRLASWCSRTLTAACAPRKPTRRRSCARPAREPGSSTTGCIRATAGRSAGRRTSSAIPTANCDAAPPAA